eukprot:g2155.t1
MRGGNIVRINARRGFAGKASPPKYDPSQTHLFRAPDRLERDVVIIGGGHNGLVAATYLARAGLDVLVLERRHCVGGAAVTEEIVPGFKFSRASYLAGLMRPRIVEELNLEKYGFEYIPREFSSFTPTHIKGPNAGKYLLMGRDLNATKASIAQWSESDADAYVEYELFLDRMRELVVPLLDAPPPNLLFGGGIRESRNTARQLAQLCKVGWRHRESLVPLYELITGSAMQILDRWFDGDVLKTTLACDAVIGALVGPRQVGSAYVLLHHVMGEAAGQRGVWAYMRGGMGTVSNSIASAARDAGVEIVTNARVSGLLSSDEGEIAGVVGVQLEDGTKVGARRAVISGAGPYHTFMELCDETVYASNPAARDFAKHLKFQDHGCGAFKINVALNDLPDFACCPSPRKIAADGTAAYRKHGPQHTGTIHFEETVDDLDRAYREASNGKPATRPVIEMTIPSTLDDTLAPKGHHVAQLFVQFAPYDLASDAGGNWSEQEFKDAFVRRVFDIVDEHCPNFSSSIVGYDALSPLDLERIFGLHKGNIFHGAMSLPQLAWARPVPGYSGHRSPVPNLYMCSAGTHPGGGVMGAPGRHCAEALMKPPTDDTSVSTTAGMDAILTASASTSQKYEEIYDTRAKIQKKTDEYAGAVYSHKAFELDEVHLKTLRTIFTLLDKDQDKLLNVQELRLAIVAMGIPPSKRLIDEITRSAPSWAGKGIDFGTFQRVIVDRLKSNPIHMADVDELFRLFEDSNERGAVTPGNLRHLMTRVKTSNSTQLSNHEVDEIFDELDIKDTPVYYRRFLTDISSGFVNFTYPMRR